MVIKRFNKSLIIVLAIMMFFLPIQQERAKAVGWVIPAGIEIGAGAYVVTALAVAGVAGALGYSEYEEEIKTHATEAWEGANDVVKQSLLKSIVATVEAGQTTIEFGQEFIDWYQGVFTPEFATDMGVAVGMTQAEMNQVYVQRGYTVANLDGTFNSRPMYKKMLNIGKSDRLKINTSGWYQENVMVATRAYNAVQSSWYTEISWFGIGGLQNYIHYDKNGPNPINIDMNSTDVWYWTNVMVNYARARGATITIEKGEVKSPTFDAYAKQVGDRVEKVMNHAVNQGISLPLTDIAPRTATGQTATFNPDVGLWRLPDGTWLEDVSKPRDWAFPVPQVVTNPDGTVTTNPDTTLPQTEVTTGDGVITDPITGTFNPPLVETGAPTAPAPTYPSDAEPAPSKIHWKKLIGLGNYFTTRFPFSLPWDVGRAFNGVFGQISDSDTPVFNFPVTYQGKTHQFKITFPDWILPWLPFWRGAVLIMFDIGIIYAIRKWFGGAS